MQQTPDLPGWQPGLRSTLLIGGRFQLLDEIGLGATAVVYKAREASSGAVVALKVLKGSAAIHPRLMSGFRREAEIGSTIQHPYITRIYDFGVHDTWIYLAMEYVPGRTLAEILSLTPQMPIGEVEVLYRHLLSALDCIHQHGIVHRDVKPGNLMKAQNGDWKLMDFGVARRVDANPTVGPSLGTPEYMSPEQLMGEKATPASDLYSAGVVLFEALAGSLPFREWRFLDRCTRTVPRLREFRPSAPEWLDAVVAKALQPKLDARLHSAKEMLAAIGPFVETVVEPPRESLQVFLPAIPVDESKPLVDFLTDEPGKMDEVFEHFLDVLRLLQQRAAVAQRHDPVTPWTVRFLPSGRAEISVHNPTGALDTLTVESPKYAAPEMMRGRAAAGQAERVRSDVYALGFMIYEQLLGRTRFQREFAGLDESGSGLSWMEWHSDLAKVLRPLSELIPAVPAAVSNLVVQMTSKDPAKRSATYEDAIRVLQGLLHRVQATQQLQVPVLEPARVSIPGTGKRFRETAVLIVSAIGTIVLLAVVALVWQLWR